MTEAEVKIWIEYHKARHPDFVAWRATLDANALEAIYELWIRALAEVPLDGAQDVSDAIVLGDVEPLEGWTFNRDFNQLGAFVRKHAKRARPFKLSGSCNATGKPLTYACKHCRDTGYRDIYHPNSVIAVVRGLDPRDASQSRALHTCTVLCDCRAGEGIASAQRDSWSDAQKFQPRYHCECPDGDVVKHGGDLATWVAAKQDVTNHPSYTSAFAEYNE